MSEDKRLEIAKKYVDKQLATMGRGRKGHKKITSAQYQQILKRVAKAVQT